MSIVLENAFLRAVFTEKGAELVSLKNKQEEIEYIWQGDSAYWGRHAPVLFPIVGKLKNDQYKYQDTSYTMSQHGFARDSVFTLIGQDSKHISFQLTDSESTKQAYPFQFVLTIKYYLEKQSLRVVYEVNNPVSNQELYFSIGGHPAFNVPLVDHLTFTDYYLEFTPRKTRTCLPLNGNLIDYGKRTLAQTNTAIQLKRDWFKNDAHIFETKGDNHFSICTDEDKHGITLSYMNFPFIGIWTCYPAEAPFVCIEPWFGIADTVDSTGNLEEKLGIQKLAGDETFSCEYTIKTF